MHLLVDLRSATYDKSPISVYAKALIDDFLSLTPTEDLRITLLLSTESPTATSEHPTVKVLRIHPAKIDRYVQRLAKQGELDAYWSIDPAHSTRLIGRNVVTIQSIEQLESLDEVHGLRGLLRRDRFQRRILSATLLFVPTAEMKARLLKRFPLCDASRIRILPHGVSPVFRQHTDAEITAVRRKYLLPKKYTVIVAHENVTDNLETPLLTLATHTEVPAMQCLLIGAGEATPKIKALIRANHLEGMIRFMEDTLAGSELSTLISGAQILMAPSLSEGFVPSISFALASGTPVICSATRANEEAYGAAALRVHATNADEWQKAFTSLILSGAMRERYIARGLAFAAEHTWRSATRDALPLIQEQLQSL